MPVLALLILVPLLAIALIPVSLVARIRRGTMRRQARGWVVTANLLAVTLSVVLFLVTVLIVSAWDRTALPYTGYGFAAGCLLGLLGYALTRWDRQDGRAYYTPNRWLVLAVTFVVAARVCYGFWRMADAWRASVEQMAWVASAGLTTSMSAGAIVLGYYFVYWAALRRRLRSQPA